MLSLFVAIMLVLIPITLASAEAASPPTINAGSALMIDARSGKVLYELNSTDKVYPASTTKMMTAILAIESGKLDDVVTCGNEVKVPTGSSVMVGDLAGAKQLQVGEKIKLNDLLYGMLLVSGNDAACATAVHLGGSIAGFADMMNAKAKDLGMNDTHFVNPHGVQNNDHYSTAADMAKLAQYCMKNVTFRKVADTAEYTVPADNKSKDRKLSTTNKLISKDPKDSKYNYNGAVGIKTGLTNTANGCLAAEAVKNEMQLIVCIYNDKNPSGLNRWVMAKKLFDWGFNNFVSVDITSRISRVTIPPLAIADQEVVATPVFVSGDKQYYTAEKDKVNRIDTATITATPTWTKKEGFKKGDQIGTVEYKIDENTVVATAALKAEQDFITEASATNEPDPSNAPPSPSGLGSLDDKHMTDISVVAIVIVIVVLVAGVIMLVVLLMRRRRKNANYDHDARKRRGSNGRYNYRRKF